MSRFADVLLVRIALQEIRLRSCCARLAAEDDAEALHDLRINLRTLRSLLRPLRGLPAVDLLEQAAAELGRLSNPLRELQVLVGELQRVGLAMLADEYAARLDAPGPTLLASAQLQRLFELLEGFPPIWRLANREGDLQGLGKRIRRHLRRQLRKLHAPLGPLAGDLHVLRLRGKRLRYGSEVYPQLSPLRRGELRLLRQLQKSLGDWNDCQHWLECAAMDDRLAACQAPWLARADESAAHAQSLLQSLQERSG